MDTVTKTFLSQQRLTGSENISSLAAVLKQLQGLVEGFAILRAHQVLVSARGKIPNLM